jgi:hypothetical protein
MPWVLTLSHVKPFSPGREMGLAAVKLWLAVAVLKAAVTDAEPGVLIESSPAELMEPEDVGVRLQVAVEVTSLVEPSL